MPGLHDVLAGVLDSGLYAIREAYTGFCQKSPQGNKSSGPLGLPFMRPDPACRTFNSSSVEVR